MIKGLIFLAFYLTCSMSNIILPTSAFSQSPLTAKNKTPLSKIDTRLLPEINNATAQSMIVDLMVTWTVPTSQRPALPAAVHIIQDYTVVNETDLKCQVGEILNIAALPQVISIAWNLPIQTESFNGPLSATSQSNGNPNFANFTQEIDTQDLWSQGYNGSKITIAVLDTGIDITGSGVPGGDLGTFDGSENGTTKCLGAVSMVPDEPLYYEDLNGRGTFITGVACGLGIQNSSYIGVAPGANYLNVKVVDFLGITYWSFIISGIQWAMEA